MRPALNRPASQHDFPSYRFLGAIISFVLLAVITDAAESTQTVTLVPGWNSVWLEVEPTYSVGDDAGTPKRVEDVFTNNAVTVVTRLSEEIGVAEVFSNASNRTFNQQNWDIWRRSPAGATNTLRLMRGNAAYLAYNSSGTAVVTAIRGTIRFFTPTWTTDRYNLVAFSLHSPVSFAEFFGPASDRHPLNRIFRLENNGNWRGVTASEQMHPGEAYWIYADGPSTYQGPGHLVLTGASRDALEFGSLDGALTIDVGDAAVNSGAPLPVDIGQIAVINPTDATVSVIMTSVHPDATTGAATTDDLLLYEVTPDPDNLQFVSDGFISDSDLGDLAAGASRFHTFAAFRNWSVGSVERENLYRISFDHHYFWLPVSAVLVNSDVGAALTADAVFQGLWVGDAVIDEVTSFTETGQPLRNAVSTTALRLIVHIDDTGQAVLLSQVTVMQRTPPADPERVLVVDAQKLPFFQGIEERAGKPVGVRIETVAYDMPRNFDPALYDTQDSGEFALLSAVQDAFGLTAVTDVTASQIQTYVAGRQSRPHGLRDDYDNSLPLEGGLGQNAVLKTYDNRPLHLDPFHRSNPFRHAFHNRHAAGYNITRVIRITMDDTSSVDRRSGVYEEIVSGLTAADITSRGTVTFSRVNQIATIQ